LAGNPAALKRAMETGGKSVLRGLRNMARDVTTNRGMPRMVDTTPFKVGETLACSPGAVVYREDLFELIHYQSTTNKVRERPLVVVPPELNRYYVLDLAPGRSLVEYAVSQGIETFMVIWRNPSRDKAAGHGLWGLDEYVSAHIRALEVVRDITGSDQPNLLGLCAGGMTGALTQAYLAAEGKRLVYSATYLVTMLDARLPNMVTMTATPQMGRVLERQAQKAAVIDSGSVARNFAWMRPNDLVFSYLVNDWLMGDDPPAFDVLAWNNDASNVSARFIHESMAMLASGQVLEPGTFSILGTPIDLHKVVSDNFIVAGLTDHITTWRPCYRTSQLLGGSSEVVIVDSGHIQSFVCPIGKAKTTYWSGPASTADADEWLAQADEHAGSWWPKWGQWLSERSGGDKQAPEMLGNAAHPPIEPAPGRYVHET
jgi:polyhydroxyalkanoate synthase